MLDHSKKSIFPLKKSDFSTHFTKFESLTTQLSTHFSKCESLTTQLSTHFSKFESLATPLITRISKNHSLGNSLLVGLLGILPLLIQKWPLFHSLFKNETTRHSLSKNDATCHSTLYYLLYIFLDTQK